MGGFLREESVAPRRVGPGVYAIFKIAANIGADSSLGGRGGAEQGISKKSCLSLSLSLDNPPGPHNGLSWGAPSLASLPGGLAARMAERGSLGLGPEGCQGTVHPRVGWAQSFNTYLSPNGFGGIEICIDAFAVPW